MRHLRDESPAVRFTGDGSNVTAVVDFDETLLFRVIANGTMARFR